MSDVCFYAAVAHSHVLCSSAQVMFIYAKIILHPAFCEGRTLCRKAEVIVVVFSFFSFSMRCRSDSKHLGRSSELLSLSTAQNKKESHRLYSHSSFVLGWRFLTRKCTSVHVIICVSRKQKMQVQRQHLKKTNPVVMLVLVCHKSKYTCKRKVLFREQLHYMLSPNYINL